MTKLPKILFIGLLTSLFFSSYTQELPDQTIIPWDGCDLGTWKTFQYKSEKNEFTRTISVTKVNPKQLVQLENKSSTEDAYTQTLSLNPNGFFGLPPSVTEKKLRDEILIIGSQKFPCEVIEKQTRRSPPCGNDPVNYTIEIEHIWKCKDTSINNGILKTVYQGNERHLQDGTLQKFNKKLIKEVIALQEEINIKGNTYPCIVLKTTRKNEERFHWLSSKIPGGEAKIKIIQWKGEKRPLHPTDISEQTVIEFEVKMASQFSK